METVTFSAIEKDQLLQAIIIEAEVYRKKKLAELSFVFFAAAIVLAFLTYLTLDSSTGVILAEILIVAFMFLIVLIGWKLARRPIDLLKKDVSSGLVVVGESTIKTINRLNREVTLTDGTKVFEPDLMIGQWKRGDIISYRITSSGEHIFTASVLKQNLD